MDMTSLTTLLGSIKTATEIAKLIKDSGATLEQAEMRLKLADLIGALADAKLEIATVQGAMADREARIRELEEAARIRDTVRYEDPSYWLESSTGRSGPFCQHCYDTQSKLVRLQDGSDGAWHCLACKGYYRDLGRRAREEAEAAMPINYPRGSY